MTVGWFVCANSNTSRLDAYRFRLRAVNSEGDESAWTDIYAYTGPLNRSLTHYTSPQLQLVEPASLGANQDEVKWYEAADDGAGSITVSWGISSVGFTSDTRYMGAWINVYACNAAGVIVKQVARHFFGGGELYMASDAYSTDQDYGLAYFGFNGLAEVWDSSDATAPSFVVEGNGSKYYRYKIQWAGAGDQVTKEYDLTIRGGSSTVHGPI